MTTPTHQNVTTSQLAVGDVIRHHGMRLLIDRPLTAHHGYGPADVFWSTPALCLNADEISDRFITRVLASDGGRWHVQGNDRATWAIEVPSTSRILKAGTL